MTDTQPDAIDHMATRIQKLRRQRDKARRKLAKTKSALHLVGKEYRRQARALGVVTDDRDRERARANELETALANAEAQARREAGRWANQRREGQDVNQRLRDDRDRHAQRNRELTDMLNTAGANYTALTNERDRERATLQPALDLLHTAWGVIVNAPAEFRHPGTSLDHLAAKDNEWGKAAVRFRENYHELLGLALSAAQREAAAKADDGTTARVDFTKPGALPDTSHLYEVHTSQRIDLGGREPSVIADDLVERFLLARKDAKAALEREPIMGQEVNHRLAEWEDAWARENGGTTREGLASLIADAQPTPIDPAEHYHHVHVSAMVTEADLERMARLADEVAPPQDFAPMAEPAGIVTQDTETGAVSSTADGMETRTAPPAPELEVRRCSTKTPHTPHTWWDEHEPDATQFDCLGTYGNATRLADVDIERARETLGQEAPLLPAERWDGFICAPEDPERPEPDRWVPEPFLVDEAGAMRVLTYLQEELDAEDAEGDLGDILEALRPPAPPTDVQLCRLKALRITPDGRWLDNHNDMTRAAQATSILTDTQAHYAGHLQSPGGWFLDFATALGYAGAVDSTQRDHIWEVARCLSAEHLAERAEKVSKQMAELEQEVTKATERRDAQLPHLQARLDDVRAQHDALTVER